MNSFDLETFKKIIWDYYREHKRDFIWRDTHEPYHVVVSEIMLQQTQTHRVAQKFEQFIAQFPTFKDLAQATLRDVLLEWKGLGYNRRAMALHKIAQKVMQEYGGILPDDPELLIELPGIGPNTAGSICAFAFNKPTIFIETNIRSVFIFFFFKNRTEISDKEIMPLVEQAVDRDNPRQWYYALMDYGVMLKKNVVNPARCSAHYAVQSKFEGSERQIRAMILHTVTIHKALSLEQLITEVDREPERIMRNLHSLCKEGFVLKKKNVVKLADGNY